MRAAVIDRNTTDSVLSIKGISHLHDVAKSASAAVTSAKSAIDGLSLPSSPFPAEPAPLNLPAYPGAVFVAAPVPGITDLIRPIDP